MEKIARREQTQNIASMLSWLSDHMHDEGTPENIQYAVRSYNNTGMFPSKVLAEAVRDYYKATRKFLPGEVIKDIDGLKQHPHNVLLEKITAKGIIQDRVEQLKRIIEKGHELQGNMYLWEEKRLKAERAAREEKQRDMKEQSNILLESLYAEEKVDKHIFRRVRFINGVFLRDVWNNKEYHRDFGHIKPRLDMESTVCFYEFDDEGTAHVYELDQSPPYGMDAEMKYFVVVGEHLPREEKMFTKGALKTVDNKVHRARGYPSNRDVDEWATEAAQSMMIKRYSCAQVVMSQETNQPAVLLRGKAVPLENI